MMRFFKKYTAAILAPILFFSSCTMMREYLPDCPYGLYVKFSYDYNIQRADMFKDHVGHICLNVYDESGKKVAQRIITNNGTENPLGAYGFTVYFPNEELKPGHSYRLQAVGMQKDWDTALSLPGAKYRRSDDGNIADHHIKLDHKQPETDLDCGHNHVDNSAPLDTLWHTLKVTSTLPLDKLEDPGVHPTRKPYSIYPIEEQLVRVDPEKYTFATVSLIRDTKHLNITLRQIDDPANIRHDDFEVFIVDDNTHLDTNNEIVKEAPVHYNPYASWTTRFLSDGTVDVETEATTEEVMQRTAHYDLMFNRVMYPEKGKEGGRLLIKNKTNGKTVADISLPHILAEGHTAYEMYNYGHQEYLDREHDYRLDFLLKGDTWSSVYVVINVLSWNVRIDNIEIK